MHICLLLKKAEQKPIEIFQQQVSSRESHCMEGVNTAECHSAYKDMCISITNYNNKTYLICTCAEWQCSVCPDGHVDFICSLLTFRRSASDSVPSELWVTAWMRSVRLVCRCSNLSLILWKMMSRMLQVSGPTRRLEGGRCPLTDCGLDRRDVRGLSGRLFRAQYRGGQSIKDHVARAAVESRLHKSK